MNASEALYAYAGRPRHRTVYSYVGDDATADEGTSGTIVVVLLIAGAIFGYTILMLNAKLATAAVGGLR